MLILLCNKLDALFHFSAQVEDGIRFMGDSYAAVETGQSEMSLLEFSFKTLSPSGVLFYIGEVTLDLVNSSQMNHGNILVREAACSSG